MTVSAALFAEHANRVIERLEPDAGIHAAADLLSGALQAGGVIQAFGTGHSQAAALEIAGRAGGLIPTNRIALSDLVLYGGDPPEVLADPLLERSPGVAHRLLGLVQLSDSDAFVIVSNSGINQVVVDMALAVTERGFPLVAITSVEHSGAVASRHPSGKHLAEIADVVIDNHGPPGDSLLPTAGGVNVCAVSSITTAFVVQMLVAEIVRRLDAAGADVPVYVSANVPGGHERNLQIEERYPGRLRRWAM